MGGHGQHDAPRGGHESAGRDERARQDRAGAHERVDVARARGTYVSFWLVYCARVGIGVGLFLAWELEDG